VRCCPFPRRFKISPRSRGTSREVARKKILLARSARSAINFSQVLFDDHAVWGRADKREAQLIVCDGTSGTMNSPDRAEMTPHLVTSAASCRA
jgi:hypothetical protein